MTNDEEKCLQQKKTKKQRNKVIVHRYNDDVSESLSHCLGNTVSWS